MAHYLKLKLELPDYGTIWATVDIPYPDKSKAQQPILDMRGHVGGRLLVEVIDYEIVQMHEGGE